MQIVCKIFTNYVNACREFQFEETTEQRNKQKQNAHNSKQIGSGRGVLSLFSFMHNTYGILYTFLLLLPFYIAVGQCRLTLSEHYHSKMPPERSQVQRSAQSAFRIHRRTQHFLMAISWWWWWRYDDVGGDSGWWLCLWYPMDRRMWHTYTSIGLCPIVAVASSRY